MAHDKDAVARLDDGEDGGADRRHSAGEAACSFGSLKLGDTALEIVNRRIADARVDVSAGVPGKGLFHRAVVREGKERGLIDWAYDGVVDVLGIIAEDERSRLDRRVRRFRNARLTVHVPGPTGLPSRH